MISEYILLLCLTCSGGPSGNGEEEPALKKKREQQRYVESEEFQKILNAKSRHSVALQAVWQEIL